MDTAIQVIIQLALCWACGVGVPACVAALTWHLFNQGKR